MNNYRSHGMMFSEASILSSPVSVNWHIAIVMLIHNIIAFYCAISSWEWFLVGSGVFEFISAMCKMYEFIYFNSVLTFFKFLLINNKIFSILYF